MTALVSLRNITKTYQRGPEQVQVLHGIDLDIANGDFVALMGPSGSGKTTLLNLIGGLDSPSGGEIEIQGERIDRMSGGQLATWRSHHVGFVFQFYNLMPMLTAQKNVELPLLLTSLNAAQRKRNAEIALTLVGLQERRTHKPSELSGGQQQRVAIARAIAVRPDFPDLRRTHRRSGSPQRRRNPAPAAGTQSRTRQDHRDGHPRPQGRRVRHPYHPPGQGRAGRRAACALKE